MEAIQISLLLSVGIGCFIGILRFVLDDKWNVLPKHLCRFCASFWVTWFPNWILIGWLLYHGHSIIYTIIAFALGIAVATVISCISYVYIKNAN